MWSLKSALEHLEATYPFPDDPAWQWLKSMLQEGPTFYPGQAVYYRVTAEMYGVRLEKWEKFYISSCRPVGTSERREWQYTLVDALPAAYSHGGKVSIPNVCERDLRVEMEPE